MNNLAAESKKTKSLKHNITQQLQQSLFTFNFFFKHKKSATYLAN